MELEELKATIQDMQLEIDILKETIDVLKKDPGISKILLNNKEKAVIDDTLKKKYSLPVLLKKLNLPKSSYYYQKKRLSLATKHEGDCKIIAAAFHDNKQRYGYRRIKVALDKRGYRISEKVISRIMRGNQMIVNGRNAKKSTGLIWEKSVLLFRISSKEIFEPTSQIRNGLRM